MYKKCVLILMLSVGLFSCSKAKKYSGNYICKVKGRFYQLNTYDRDTVYIENIEIKRETRAINVLGNIIPTDSLKVNEWYIHSGYPSVFQIKIVEDSVYLYKWSGGQGGQASLLYSCKELYTNFTKKIL